MSSTTLDASPMAGRSTLGPMIMIGVLFFIFGFVTWLNGPLITFVKLAFQVPDAYAFLVPFAFYISYLVFSLPASLLLKRTGMKKGMALGCSRWQWARCCSASSSACACLPARWPGCS